MARTLGPADFPVLFDVGVRYGDLGPDGTVAVVGLARWFEDARIGVRFARFHRMAADGDFGTFRILLATQTVERHGPLTWDAKYRVGIGIRRVGRSSFTYAYAVFADDGGVDGGAPLATGETVTVFGTSSGVAELPDELRADLDALLLDGPAADPAPRPGRERHDRGAYPFSIPLRARVGDVDTNRHGNNVAVLGWYTEAVAALHTELLGTGWGGPPPELAPASYRVQYVAEVGYPATYDLALAVTAADDEQVHYALGLFLDDRCVGLADATGPRGDLPADALTALAPQRSVS